MKKHIVGALSLIGLAVIYLAVRYPLFFLHGMKQFPFILFVPGAVIIAISGLAFCGKILPASVSVGYIVGFVLGFIFQFDYGVGLNSLWIIWSCVYFAAIIIGAAAEIICRKRKTN